MSPDDDHRYRKEDRLRRPAEFRRVLRRGRRRRGRRFDVVVAPGGSIRGARLGIAVPKAVGGAVVRSRLKRVVREFFRTHREVFPSDADVVIIARPGPGAVNQKNIEEIGKLLEAMTGWRNSRSRSARPAS